MAKRGFLPPAVHDDGSLFNEKRNKITRPAKSSKSYKKRSKINNNGNNNNSKKSTTEKKGDADVNASANSPKNDSNAEASSISKKSESKPSTSSDATSDFVEPAIAKDFIAKYSVQPRPDMRVRCKVPGKESPMKGSLKYLGRISNLPKRSNVVVAGIQLEREEDLGTDGTFLGKRYFTAPNKHGYFVPMKNCTPM